MHSAFPDEAAIRLMLVDDHQVVRAGLRLLLGDVPLVRIVGEAASVAEAIGEAARLQPEVILMDLRLPDGTGIDACREILSRNPGVRIVFLTAFSDEEAVMSTILAGAAGYLLKDLGHHAIVKAIVDAAAGRDVIDAKVRNPALRQVRAALEKPATRPSSPEALSAQERRVLSLVVEGKTNRQIALALELSEKTVKNYLSNAFQKLGVRRRSHAAVLFASKAGKRT